VELAGPTTLLDDEVVMVVEVEALVVI